MLYLLFYHICLEIDIFPSFSNTCSTNFELSTWVPDEVNDFYQFT
jgi:hypothetical protein